MASHFTAFGVGRVFE
ncbi:hypothetical protein RDG66_17235 [Vibrio cholerae]|nr:MULTISPECIES: hypothetical protein [Vibrio]